jgi:hypothetical protein
MVHPRVLGAARFGGAARDLEAVTERTSRAESLMTAETLPEQVITVLRIVVREKMGV